MIESHEAGSHTQVNAVPPAKIVCYILALHVFKLIKRPDTHAVLHHFQATQQRLRTG